MSFEAFEAIQGVPIKPGTGDLAGRVSIDRARLVLTHLAVRANDEGIAWPSVATIAEGIAIPGWSVRHALRLLERQGLIEAVGGRSGGRRSTRYRIRLNPRDTPRDVNPRGVPRVDTVRTRGVSHPNPRGVPRQPAGCPAPNTTNVTKDVGGGRRSRSADADLVAKVGKRINDRLDAVGEESVDVVGELAPIVGRLVDDGWFLDDAIARIFAKWPPDVTSPRGLVLSRLKRLEPPTLEAVMAAAASRVASDLDVVDGCDCDITADVEIGRHELQRNEGMTALGGPWLALDWPPDLETFEMDNQVPMFTDVSSIEQVHALVAVAMKAASACRAAVAEREATPAPTNHPPETYP